MRKGKSSGAQKPVAIRALGACFETAQIWPLGLYARREERRAAASNATFQFSSFQFGEPSWPK
jgi:hypothetical protein